MLHPVACCDLFARGAVMPRQLRGARPGLKLAGEVPGRVIRICRPEAENCGNSHLSKPDREERLIGLSNRYCAHLRVGRGE